MATLRNKRNNSLPAINMNKFFVSKRASMFEAFEETPRDRRERSPCGLLEISERKLEARKEKEKKDAMVSRRKRQADPYAEASTEADEEDQLGIESKVCGHANRSVNLAFVRRNLKQPGVMVGECTLCKRAKDSLGHYNSLFVEEDNKYDPVIWLCCYCANQGCDRNSRDKHAYHHYKTPRSDQHSLVLNTQSWTVWCYECDSEVILTCSKKLHEVVNYVKRQSEMAPQKDLPTTSRRQPTRQHTTNLTTQYSGSDSRLHLATQYFEDNSKNKKNSKNYQASVLAALPKVKGITNLGNTCFFNSVIQSLSQTHYLTQILDVHVQKGQKVWLPGRTKWSSEDDKNRKDLPSKIVNGETNYSSESEQETEDNIELKPLDLYLSEGGSLTVSFAAIIKEMHCVGRSNLINPGHLLGLISSRSKQFQGNQQQDAHELLRCLLDAIRNEEVLRMKKSILRSFGFSEKTNPNSVPARMRKVIKGYGKQAAHTIVDEIFSGQLISTVFCEECHWSSQVFEPFMDLSLPINEEKGKPKKSNSLEDDGIFDCFGRPSVSSSNLSKRQQKMQKYERRKNSRRHSIKKEPKISDASLPSITVNLDENDEKENRKEEKRKKRLTEKRRPEDEEEFRLKREAEQKAREERQKQLEQKRKSESSKFKMLMQARSNSKKGSGGEVEGGESGQEEEEEYDEEDDEDEDDSFGIKRKYIKETNTTTNNFNRNSHNRLIDEEEIQEEEEGEEEEQEEEEEEEEEEEDEDEEEEEETNETNSSSSSSGSDASSTKNTKKRSSRETSDADVEDNTDSEYIHNSFRPNTRQPSIVVDESVSDPISSETVGIDNRFLRTSNSCDNLNYYSDASERYFTAQGPDTMDELEPGFGDSGSVRSDRTYSSLTTTTSGKGDSISVSSGDFFGVANYEDRKITGFMDELSFKVGDLKIRHKSSSKESLLDAHPKHRSTELLPTINSEEDETNHKKGHHTIKKLKQEWISRSLTTLSPRYQCGRQECSVLSCLSNFTSPELLTGNNKITCENCSKLRSHMNGETESPNVKSNASKQLLILSPPAVLTLHLKRFHHVGYNLAKVNRFVQFPLVLDLAPFTSSISLGLNNMSRGQSQVLYTLFGVVEHSGRLNSGHYVAYVRSRPLDSSRTVKQFLNLKPSSQFQMSQLITDMAQKIDSEGGLHKNPLKASTHGGASNSVKVEDLEEEIKAGRWFHVSDAYVSEVNFEKVIKAQAYLLFYERIL